MFPLILLVATAAVVIRTVVVHNQKKHHTDFGPKHKWPEQQPQGSPPPPRRPVASSRQPPPPKPSTRIRRPASQRAPQPAPAPVPTPKPAPVPTPNPAPKPTSQGYPGDYEGRLPPQRSYYDTLPSSGDVVKTWVPERENHARGQIREVVVVARENQWMLGVEITYDVAPFAPDRIDVAAADWDADRRPAQILIDRIVRLLPEHLEPLDASLPRSEFLALRRRLER